MDQFNEQNNTVDLNTSTPVMTEHKSAAGPIVGAVIIVLVVVLGGVYFWGSRMPVNEPEVVAPAPVTAATPAADDPDQISKELNATSATTADADLVGATDAIKGI